MKMSEKSIERMTKIMIGGVAGLAIFEIARSLGYKEACRDLQEDHEHLVNSCKNTIDSLSKEYENSIKLLDEEYERALEEEKPENILQEVLEDFTKEEFKEITEFMKEAYEKFKRSIL